jgi:GT2 family glycosyltransferase
MDPVSPTPAISIVLVTYGKAPVTERCLESPRDTHGPENRARGA